MRFRLTEQAPMLPVTAALAAGIIVASWRMPPVWISAAGVAACAAAAAATLRTNRNAATAAILLACMFLGTALTALQLRTDTPAADYAVYEAVLDNDALRRPDTRTRQADARLTAMRDDSGHWRRMRGRLRIYADTSLRLTAGQHIVCRARVRPFGGNDADSRYDGYNRMMRRKGFAGHIYLDRGSLLHTSPEVPSARLRALHRQAVAKIARLPLQPDNMAVAQAVGTGERTLLDRRLRSDYSHAGTAHLLALSGLHVGIVFVLINLLLHWLPLVAHGHKIRCVAAIALLWLYVAATGMPPSAVRAALMFSLLQIARAASADYSALNALATAAFISLCFNTGLLYDAGFRLSYIAVAAILFGALPLIRHTRIHAGRRRSLIVKSAAAALNFISATIITGFAATTATAPLISHMFGFIPLAGIVAGPAAIAAAAATVLLTAVWLLLPLGFAAPLFGRMIDMTTGAMNALSAWTARCGCTIELRLNGAETAVCYIAAAAVVCALAAIRNNNSPTHKFPTR